MRRIIPALLAALIGLAATAPSQAAEQRFVSIRAERANLRTGPGTQYPVQWEYRRPLLPVELLAEVDEWRQVRDNEGTQGWFHRQLISSRRTILVTAPAAELRATREPESRLVAKAERGVVGLLLACPEGPVCRVEVSGLVGWAPRAAIWGVGKDEVVE